MLADSPWKAFVQRGSGDRRWRKSRKGECLYFGWWRLQASVTAGVGALTTVTPVALFMTVAAGVFFTTVMDVVILTTVAVDVF